MKEHQINKLLEEKVSVLLAELELEKRRSDEVEQDLMEKLNIADERAHVMEEELIGLNSLAMESANEIKRMRIEQQKQNDFNEASQQEIYELNRKVIMMDEANRDLKNQYADYEYELKREKEHVALLLDEKDSHYKNHDFRASPNKQATHRTNASEAEPLPRTPIKTHPVPKSIPHPIDEEDHEPQESKEKIPLAEEQPDLAS